MDADFLRKQSEHRRSVTLFFQDVPDDKWKARKAEAAEYNERELMHARVTELTGERFLALVEAEKVNAKDARVLKSKL